jgi:hypothetical protein
MGKEADHIYAERLEDELLGNIPPQGFRQVITIGRLAGVRSQPN